MILNKQNDYERLREMSFLTKTGWWEADFTQEQYIISDSLVELLGLEGNALSFKAFRELIREDYKKKVHANFDTIRFLNTYDQVFPICPIKGEECWLHSYMTDKKEVEGRGLIVTGYVQCIASPEQAIINRIIDPVVSHNSISHSLNHFVKEDNPDEGVIDILTDVLRLYQGSRAYIFEYDESEKFQSCTYEVVAEGISEEIDSLKLIPVEFNAWWSSQILNAKSIILNTIEELPEIAKFDYEVLSAQDIKSLLVVPLFANNKTIGYMGVDLVNQFRVWSPDDYQWMVSLSNIVSICIELGRTKDIAVRERNFLNNLFRYMPLGYIRFTQRRNESGDVTDYFVADINEKYIEFSGRETEQIKGKLATEVEPGLSNKLNSLFENIDENQYRELDYYFERTDKICRAILYSPVPNEVVGLFLDFTETERINKALDSSEKLFQNLFSDIPLGVELYDKDGILTDLNNKDQEIFGVKREEAIGLSFFENPNISDTIKENVRTKDQVEFRVNYQFDIAENYYTPEKRGYINLYTKVRKLYDKQGVFNGYVFINIDNTEKIDAINKIQDFENLFMLISDFAKVGYAKLNYITKEGYAIKQWFKNMGEDEDASLGDVVGVYSKMHPEDREIFLTFYEDVMKGTGDSFRRDMRVLRPGTTDEWNWVRVHVIVISYHPEKGEIEIMGINYDITELKEIELKLIDAKNKAEEADRLKSAFLANMSHEIRTPLNAIVGFSGLLVETEDMEERIEYLALVEKNNELLLQLISDVLDLSKIEAGIFDFTLAPVNVNTMCDDLVRSLRMKTPQGIDLLFDPTMPDCQIISDRNRLHQVISNFVNNAIKFTSAGSIRVAYEVCNEYIKFSVTDTGIGISQEQLVEIFDRFVKLNSFISGTGLGLSICKSIVEQMGGTIGVESEEGKGSIFWFKIPTTWVVD